MTTTVTASVTTTPPLTELVAEEIRALLARRRMSGRELARQLGTSPSWVNFRLTGAQSIDLNDLQRIADVLDVDVLDLIPERREGRVVSHIGAARRQTTVPKIGLPRRTSPNGPRGRTMPTPSTRRPALIVSAAA